MKRTTLVIALWAMVVATASAQKAGNEQQLSKEANSFFESGQYLKAYPLYSQLVSLYPQNYTYGYRFGACAIYSDPDKDNAIRYLNSATNNGVSDPMAWYYLGKAYHLNYQFREAVQAYESFVTKADPKVSAKVDAQHEIETCIYGTTLLGQIKDIVVLKKVEADKANFFRYMDLGNVGGKILTVPVELRTSFDKKKKETGVMHYPGNSTVIYFSSYGKDGSTGKDIYRANVLPDGKYSSPEKLKGDINTKYDEDYCYMHSDGKTMYFSSRGHNSMGGYDIFKSVYDPQTDSFGPAINLDFAINTPDDDIFFIADSLNKYAYFASGRSTDYDHLNVYNVMVEGIPLQVVYLKGDFVSEINPEQKNAHIEITEMLSGRSIMTSNTQSTTGNYILYIPHPGDYQFTVRTENSPTEHKNIVTIPAFDKAVALKQELRLVKNNGQEKLLISNFFESPLEEDLASLAAGMLRMKAGLDVNADENKLPKAEAITSVSEAVLALPHTIDNAPLAAGFSEGITIKSVVAGIDSDVATIQKFVKEADEKYSNAYSYAFKKQREAEADLAKAEEIRQSTSNYSTDADVVKIRESLALMNKAKAAQIEAKSAMQAAEAVKQYRESEADRAEILQQSASELRQADSSNDFDAALVALQKEKQRQVSLREGNGRPQDEMLAKAKAKDSEQKASEERLSKFREQEKTLTPQVAAAEQMVASSKKKGDREKAELNLAETQSELSAKRRQIGLEQIKVAELGEQAKEAYATASFYSRVSTDTQLGLSVNDKIAMDETQRTALGMRLESMSSRIDALEITDPQMLAVITDASMESATATSIASTGSALPTYPERSATEISSRQTEAMTRLSGTDPSLAPARRMVLSSSLDQTNDRINFLQKKKMTGITVGEKQELEQLISMRDQLNVQLASQPSTYRPSSDELRKTYSSVDPSYNESVQAINNATGTDLTHAIQLNQFKKATLAKLSEQRIANAELAMNESDPAKISTYAQRDQELGAAISTLKSETDDVKPYRAAFESSNKEIIEGTASSSAKLEQQVSLTEEYMNVLDAMKTQKDEALSMSTDQKSSESLRMQIGEIVKEKNAAESKLASYKSDRSLTTSTSEPAATQVRSSTSVDTSQAINTLEDAIENEEDIRMQGAEKLSAKMTEEAIAEKVTKDAETIKGLFKQKEETESIFAYETPEMEKMISKYASQGIEIRNQDKISELQNEIFLIEGEIENETSPGKQRRLDRKAENLYLRKSLIEIGNAENIGKMTTSEYESKKQDLNALKSASSDKIESRTMVRDELKKLSNQAESEMAEAAELRKKANNITDDIERNDYYRMAFAKETHAIQLMDQSQKIIENIDLLTSYDDQELTELRYGNPQKVSSAITAEVKGEPKSATASTTSNTEKSSVGMVDNSASDVKTDSKTVYSEGNSKIVFTNPAVTPAVETKPAEATATRAARPEAGEYSASEAANYYYEFPDLLTKDLFVRTSSSVYSNARPIPVDAGMPKGVYYKVQVGAFRNNIPQNLYDEFAPVSGETLNNGITRYTAGFFMAYDKADAAKLDIRRMGYGDAFIVAFRDGKRIPLYEAMGITEADYQTSIEKEYVYGDGGKAPSPKLDATVSNSISGTTKRTDYYKGYPDAAPATLVETTRGLFFTVQVGVYSKPTPAVKMNNINPLNSELIANNRIRYTSGIYTDMQGAVNKRKEAKSIGISDAFITAYYNGERISLSEADRLLKENGPSILYKK